MKKEEKFNIKDWEFPAPPVYSGLWKDEDWERFIKKYGRKINKK